MRRITGSLAYARTRVLIGLIAAALGVMILVRTFVAVGATANALPAYVMGAAMLVLGVVRLREYRGMRGAAPPAERERP